VSPQAASGSATGGGGSGSRRGPGPGRPSGPARRLPGWGGRAPVPRPRRPRGAPAAGRTYLSRRRPRGRRQSHRPRPRRRPGRRRPRHAPPAATPALPFICGSRCHKMALREETRPRRPAPPRRRLRSAPPRPAADPDAPPPPPAMTVRPTHRQVASRARPQSPARG
jgi:hypothetical protein